jgi:hypothetical protein
MSLSCPSAILKTRIPNYARILHPGRLVPAPEGNAITEERLPQGLKPSIPLGLFVYGLKPVPFTAKVHSIHGLKPASFTA